MINNIGNIIDNLDRHARHCTLLVKHKNQYSLIDPGFRSAHVVLFLYL